MTAGRPAETAPMSCAGTVLSQPPMSTTASMGCARIISSVSIDMRLRYLRLVGSRKTSPSEMVGNSTGSAPGAKTPGLNASRRAVIGQAIGEAHLAFGHEFAPRHQRARAHSFWTRVPLFYPLQRSIKKGFGNRKQAVSSKLLQYSI